MTGDELEMYINRYRKTVWSAAMCYVKNPSDADDIVQEVFLKMYTHEGSFTDDEHIRAWLIRCAVNMSKNLLRSHWYKFSEPLEIAENKEYSGNADNDTVDLPALFLKLSPKNRIVVYLHYYEGYSISEISGMLKITETAVGVRLMRGRKQLKKLIDDERSDINGLQKNC